MNTSGLRVAVEGAVGLVEDEEVVAAVVVGEAAAGEEGIGAGEVECRGST